MKRLVKIISLLMAVVMLSSVTYFADIVWFTKGEYRVNTWVIDAWTPDVMLSVNLSDSVNIYGSLWDDWHIGPQKN